MKMSRALFIDLILLATKYTYQLMLRMRLAKINRENYIIIKADILTSTGLKTNVLHKEQYLFNFP